MASIQQSEGLLYLYLKTHLHIFFSSDSTPTEEQEKFGRLNYEYDQIQPRVLTLIGGGQVTPELLNLLDRLKELAAAIFGITQANVKRWKMNAIKQGCDANTVNAVANDVLAEYAKRWGIARE
jgi:hypothetical protein